jgi:hypothetical protein
MGFGTLIGTTTVYMKRGRVVADNGQIVDTMLPMGDTSNPPSDYSPLDQDWQVMQDQPKILMDNEKVVYGCQVQWQPASDYDEFILNLAHLSEKGINIVGIALEPGEGVEKYVVGLSSTELGTGNAIVLCRTTHDNLNDMLTNPIVGKTH